MAGELEHLFETVIAARDSDPVSSRTARLFADGPAKMAKKVAEEAVEVALDAVQGDRRRVVEESADLLYNLTVLWAAIGVTPADVWSELAWREKTFGIAEKLPKDSGRRDAK